MILNKNLEIIAYNIKAKSLFGVKIDFRNKAFYSFFEKLDYSFVFKNWIKSDEDEKFTLKIKDSYNHTKWLDLYQVNSNFKGEEAYLISAIDVTNEKLYYENILNIINVQKTISIVSDGKKLLFANNEFLDFFNYDSLEDFLRHYHCICEKFEDVEGFFHLGLLERKEEWIEKIQELPTKDRLVALKNDDERIYCFTVRVTTFQNETYVITFLDVTDTVNEKFLLERKANHDLLTGALTREFFYDNIENILQKFEKDSSKIGIGFIDIDDFKHVNDTYGHDVGDEVLKNISNLLHEKTRENDYVFRWGGEEFLILFKIKNENSLYTILENIRVEIENTRLYEFEPLTCSLGGSICIEENIDETIKKADNMMYQAKKNGKNRVVISLK